MSEVLEFLCWVGLGERFLHRDTIAILRGRPDLRTADFSRQGRNAVCRDWACYT